MRLRGPLPVLLVSLVLTSGCDLDSVLSETARFREEFTYTCALPAGGRLDLENFNGSVEIMGWEKDEVRVSGLKFAGSEADLRELKIEVTSDGQTARVRTVAPSGRRSHAGARYMLRAPHRVELDRIRTSNGSIRAEFIQGSARLETSNGSITLRQLEGSVEARTSNGSISLTEVRGDCILRTSNGRISVERLKGALEATTSNASVSARILEPGVGRVIRLVTSNGSIELALDAFQQNEIVAQTSNGSVTVRLPASLQARLRATTSNGAIHSDFPVLAGSTGKDHLEGEIGGGGPLIRLATTNGSIRVQRF